MANDFLPKLKEFKEKYKATNEQDLTDDDIIAMLDKHLQRETSEGGEPDEDAEEDDRSDNDETPENDEIEKISDSLTKKMEEMDQYILEKKKELDEKIAKIKRKSPPSGEISDKAMSNKERLQKNCFEADI